MFSKLLKKITIGKKIKTSYLLEEDKQCDHCYVNYNLKTCYECKTSVCRQCIKDGKVLCQECDIEYVNQMKSSVTLKKEDCLLDV